MRIEDSLHAKKPLVACLPLPAVRDTVTTRRRTAAPPGATAVEPARQGAQVTITVPDSTRSAAACKLWRVRVARVDKFLAPVDGAQ